MSLTDLHKGTHNCAAAIRESGAGISPSPSPSLRVARSLVVVHPVVHPSPLPVPRLSALGGGGGGAVEPGHSVSALLSFFHTSGRRCRWFPASYYGILLYFLSLPSSSSSSSPSPLCLRDICDILLSLSRSRIFPVLLSRTFLRGDGGREKVTSSCVIFCMYVCIFI